MVKGLNLVMPVPDPGFQVRGAHLKKLRRAEGGAKNVGVFRVKNTILRQKIIFFPILGGGARRVRPPLLWSKTVVLLFQRPSTFGIRI